MKGCLKQPSPLPSPVPDCVHSRKCVAFEADGSEQVFFADEWDRTPAEPCRKLSYQDLIELKEIQRSLPLANQPSDPTTGRPARQYLSGVPITLLPLLPQAETSHHTGAQINANNITTPQQAQGNSRTTSHRNIIAAAKSRPPSNQSGPVNHHQHQQHHQTLQQPYLNGHFNPNYNHHLGKISNPTVRRLKPNFTFLPLLDTPPSSETTTPLPSNPSSRSTSPDLTSDTDQTDPPTPSLTNASLDSPISCASSLSPEPTFLQLPPRHISYGDERCHPHFGPTDSYFPGPDVDDKLAASHRHLPASVSRLRTPVGKPMSQVSSGMKVASPKPARKRNVIIVNDMEIELDQDDEDEAAPVPAPSKALSGGTISNRKKKNVIIVNDMEIELDDEEEEGDNNGLSIPTSASTSASTIPLSSHVDSRFCSLSLSDTSIRNYNRTENFKPPERKAGIEEKSTSPLFSPTSPTSPASSTTSSISTASTVDHHTPTGCHSACQSGSQTAPSNSDVVPGFAGCVTNNFGSLHMPLRFKRRTMSTESSHVSAV